MSIVNLTTGKNVAESHKMAKDFFSRLRGLMFSKPSEDALVLSFSNEFRVSLHMFFVFYPIDVIFVNKMGQVVDLKENFRPFAYYKSSEKAVLAIEFPSGALRASGTEKGHKIAVK